MSTLNPICTQSGTLSRRDLQNTIGALERQVSHLVDAGDVDTANRIASIISRHSQALCCGANTYTDCSTGVKYWLASVRLLGGGGNGQSRERRAGLLDVDRSIEKDIAEARIEKDEERRLASQLARTNPEKFIEGNKKALTVVEFCCKSTSLMKARQYIRFGLMYKVLGRFDEAVDWFQKGLAIQEQRVPNSLAVALSHDHIGEVYRRQMNFSKALEQYRASLQILERLGPERPEVAGYIAQSFDSIAHVYRMQENATEAVAWFRKSFEIYNRLAPSSLNLALCCSNIGTGYLYLIDWAAASEWYGRSRAILEALVPNYKATVLLYRNCKGSAFSPMAEELGRKAEILHSMAMLCNNTGGVYHMQGNFSEALKEFQKGLEICEGITPNNVSTVHIRRNIGRTCQKLSHLDEALTQYQKCIQILKHSIPSHDVPGVDLRLVRLVGHLSIAEIHKQTARVYVAQRNYIEAAKHNEMRVCIEKEYIPDSTWTKYYDLQEVKYPSVEGNCLFDAIAVSESHRLRSAPEPVENLRARTMEQMSKDSELMGLIGIGGKLVVFNDETRRFEESRYTSFADYDQKMRQDKTWGGENEIKILSRMLGRPIYLITDGNTGDGMYEEQLTGDPIFLRYTRGTHYVLLETKDGVDVRNIAERIAVGILLS